MNLAGTLAPSEGSPAHAGMTLKEDHEPNSVRGFPRPRGDDPCVSLAGGAAVLQAAYRGGDTAAQQQATPLLALSQGLRFWSSCRCDKTLLRQNLRFSYRYEN